MLQATVKSQKIECKFHFLVSTEFDSTLCCSSKPNIEIPIIMYIPDIRPNVQLYQPTNWNPTTMPLYEIKLPSQEEIISSHYSSKEFNSYGMMTSQVQPIRIESGGLPNQTLAFQVNQQNMSQNNTISGMKNQEGEILPR